MSRPGVALLGALAREGAAAGRSGPVVLWRFGRPHTLIGTTLSVVALYVIAVTELAGGDLAAGWFDLVCTLVAAWCVNVFIVGINQLEDVEIDRINKPFLPIAAGDLSPAAGRRRGRGGGARGVGGGPPPPPAGGAGGRPGPGGGGARARGRDRVLGAA